MNSVAGGAEKRGPRAPGFLAEKWGGPAPRGPGFWGEMGGPGPPRRVKSAPATISDTYFNGGFDIKSDENSIRKVRSVKKIRLRRATAAQRPSIVRKSL